MSKFKDLGYDESNVNKPLPPHGKAGGHKIVAGETDSYGPAFDAADQRNGGSVSEDHIGQNPRSSAQRHAAEIKRAAAVKAPKATHTETSRKARFEDSLKRNQAVSSTGHVAEFHDAAPKPAYLR